MTPEQLRLEALRLALALHTSGSNAAITHDDSRVVATAQKFADFVLVGTSDLDIRIDARLDIRANELRKRSFSRDF